MIENIHEKKEVHDLLSMAMYMGRLLLHNGAEVYRVEDTIARVCLRFPEIESADVFVTQTMIIVSIGYQGEKLTDMARTTPGENNLTKIHLLNDFSRHFVAKKLSIEDGMALLRTIDQYQTEPPLMRLFYSTLIGPFFCYLFGGSWSDFFACAVITLIMLSVLFALRKLHIHFFFDNFLGGLLASGLSYVAFRYGLCQSMDMVIIGAIMPLVPGVPLTNAVRDTLNGDYVSGLSKFAEIIFAALGIALGVGTILTLHLKGGL